MVVPAGLQRQQFSHISEGELGRYNISEGYEELMFLAEIVGIAAVLAGGEKLNLFLNFAKFLQIFLEYFPKFIFLHSGLIDDIVDIGQDITFDIFYLLVDAIEADFIFLQLFAN